MLWRLFLASIPCVGNVVLIKVAHDLQHLVQVAQIIKRLEIINAALKLSPNLIKAVSMGQPPSNHIIPSTVVVITVRLDTKVLTHLVVDDVELDGSALSILVRFRRESKAIGHLSGPVFLC